MKKHKYQLWNRIHNSYNNSKKQTHIKIDDSEVAGFPFSVYVVSSFIILLGILVVVTFNINLNGMTGHSVFYEQNQDLNTRAHNVIGVLVSMLFCVTIVSFSFAKFYKDKYKKENYKLMKLKKRLQ